MKTQLFLLALLRGVFAMAGCAQTPPAQLPDIVSSAAHIGQMQAVAGTPDLNEKHYSVFLLTT